MVNIPIAFLELLRFSLSYSNGGIIRDAIKKNIKLWNSIPPKASAFDDLTQSSISCALTQNTLRCKCSGIQKFGLFNRYGHSYIHMDNTCVHSIRKINDRHYCQSTYYVTSKFLRDSYGASF